MQHTNTKQWNVVFAQITGESLPDDTKIGKSTELTN